MNNNLIDKFFKQKKNPFTIISDENFTELLNNQDKIVLFHATWSGPSSMNISAILDNLNTLKLDGIKLFFVDIDTLEPIKIKRILGKISHGNGEAVFIKAGQISARHTNHILEFLEKLEELLVKHSS